MTLSRVITTILQLFLVGSSFAVKCPERYTLRNNICCKSVVCPPDYYVHECDSNNQSDECRRCANGTYLLDPTTSELPVKCSPRNCPEDTVETRIKSADGCSLYCKCDVRAGYCGLDPCACIIPKDKCPFGTKRAQNCGCDPIDRVPPNQNVHTTSPSTPKINNDLQEYNNDTYILSQGVEVISRSSQVEKSTTIGNGFHSHTESSWIIPLVTAVGILLILISVVVALIILHRKAIKAYLKGTNRDQTCVQQNIYFMNHANHNHNHNHNDNTVNKFKNCTNIASGNKAKLIDMSGSSRTQNSEDCDAECDENSVNQMLITSDPYGGENSYDAECDSRSQSNSYTVPKQLDTIQSETVPKQIDSDLNIFDSDSSNTEPRLSYNYDTEHQRDTNQDQTVQKQIDVNTAECAAKCDINTADESYQSHSSPSIPDTGYYSRSDDQSVSMVDETVSKH